MADEDFPLPDSNCGEFLNGEDVRKELVEVLALIHTKIGEGKALNKDEIQQYNMALKNTIVTQFTSVATKISNKLEIKPDDSPEVRRVKGLAGLTIQNYLSTVTNWLVKTVANAFEKISQGVQYCYQLVKSAFQVMYDAWFK